MGWSNHIPEPCDTLMAKSNAIMDLPTPPIEARIPGLDISNSLSTSQTFGGGSFTRFLIGCLVSPKP